MGPVRITFTSALFFIFCLVSFPTAAQLGIPITIEKPEEYEDRELRSEKSDQKKFTLPRRAMQNMGTRYNYYFNANNKLNDVVAKAKASYKEDYSKLLSFYNYSLDATAGDSIQLDSVIHKSSSGIALHDLRGDWVDNLYLLWGAAFYLRKDFDSANLMFQFINYAFAPKEKDGYYLTIGSRMDGNSALSIATNEKRSLPKRLLSNPPSRNDAFIWQIRNFLVQDKFAEAASLIAMLRTDPLFPKRLNDDLHEVQAFWFYKQNMWDSAALHLTEALGNATTKQEKARWEYLAAQLFELAGQHQDAEKYYARVSGHTTDLVLDIYARLASIRVNKDEGEKSIEKNIEALLRMAKRSRFEEYRDIIYYMAAQMKLETSDINGALALLLKSTQYASNNPEQRNKAFLQLAELSFNKALYRQSSDFYDSLVLDAPPITDPEAITIRKNVLKELVTQLDITERQDSLQRIAALPEEQRRDFVKKLVRQLRKLQGLKDESSGTGTSIPGTQPPTNLFGTGNQKGEWYFYNASSRTRGANEFQAKWGKRPNVDNWRRSAAVTSAVVTTSGNPSGNSGGAGSDSASSASEITFDALYDKLPLTPEALLQSNDSLQNALFETGKIFIQQLENCDAGSATLEGLRIRFPDYPKMEEALFNLYYCYWKNGETAKAAAIKKLLQEKYGDSRFTAILTTGKDPAAPEENNEATKDYESIYDLFIEGNFNEAIAKKKEADKKYGDSHWTPQLLYIEAVYYIKQREDSAAKTVLNSLIRKFAMTPLAEKATTLLNVLNRRKEIEEELTKMVVKRNEDSTVTIIEPPKPVITQPVITKPVTDTSNKTVQPVINPTVPVVKTDSSTVAPPVVTPKVFYTYNAAAPHYVLLILNKVDPVFSNETKNAFFRYNRETYYNKTINLELVQLDDDNRLLVMSLFGNEQEAVAYIDKALPKTATEIIPWLKGGKYSFSVISAVNYELLKTNKDIEVYKAFLEQHLPGKFK